MQCKILRAICWSLVAAAVSTASSFAAAGMQDAAQASDAKPSAHVLGTVKSVQGSSVTVASDAGVETAVTVQDQTKLLRTAPGQKTLAGATAMQLSDLQVGDRVLVRGAAGADGKSITAASIVAIKQTDIAKKQEQEREDWQRRGIGGPVKAIDMASGVITISVTDATGSKSVAVHVTPATAVKRYPPDSVKFEDAMASTLADVQVGDQLRARGTKSSDGTEFQADAIVSGAFKNIAGTVESTDAGANTLRVIDLATKKPVTVRITGDSQLRKLAPATAAMIAARLKGGARGAEAGAGNGMPAPTAAPGPPAAGAAEGNGRGARGDMQQVLGRAPTVQLTDLKKGDAVMIVATSGSVSSASTVITLLAGVEPMLQASPSASQGLLSAWNMGGGGAEAAQ